MNILILTPIHPMQIAEMHELYTKYDQYNNVYSIQAMALLAEETLNHNYTIANLTYTDKIRHKPKLMKSIGKKVEHIIIFGNIDKRTDMKFDHILGYTNHYAENEQSWDLYADEIVKIADMVYEQSDKKIAKKPQYYKQEDAHHIFPTLRHLFLFLKTIGVKENDEVDDTIQSETTGSN